jgi:GTP-binding protein EngB required for normal cell division
VPYLLILTKSDKLPFSKLGKQIDIYKERFHAQIADGSCRGIVPFSIVSGVGRLELLKDMEDHIEPPRKSRKEAV